MKDNEIFQKQKTLAEDFDYLNDDINIFSSIQITKDRLFKTIHKRPSNLDIDNNFSQIIEPKNYKIILLK